MRALTLSFAASLVLAACSSDSGPTPGTGGSAGSGGVTNNGGAGSPSAGMSVGGGGGGGGPLGGSAGESQAGMAGAQSGAGAGGGSAGGGAGGSAGVPAFVEPTKLSETGFYTDTAKGTLAPDVLEYQPKYELWSDSATKKRWVYLPPGSKIDTSTPREPPVAPMDFWVYPVGTKIWKEFSRDGKRIETRLIQKHLDSRMRPRWFMSAFVWNEALTDADATTDGVENAGGTTHDVPSRKLCGDCHDNVFDRVLGFSAIQLSHDLPGVKLSDLVSEDKLTMAPSGSLTIPGDADEQKVLGYLHANCGHCHNETGQHSALNLVLWLGNRPVTVDGMETMGSLASVANTHAVLTTVGIPAGGPAQPDDDLRIVRGNAAESELYQRLVMAPGTDLHMPLVGSEVLDTPNIEAIEAFIESL